MIAANNVPQTREDQRIASLDWLISDIERREAELAKRKASYLEARACESGEPAPYAVASLGQ